MMKYRTDLADMCKLVDQLVCSKFGVATCIIVPVQHEEPWHREEPRQNLLFSRLHEGPFEGPMLRTLRKPVGVTNVGKVSDDVSIPAASLSGICRTFSILC